MKKERKIRKNTFEEVKEKVHEGDGTSWSHEAQKLLSNNKHKNHDKRKEDEEELFDVIMEFTLGEKCYFLTNQFLISCWAQLALDCINIFISTNSTWPASHLNLANFLTKLVSA
jgi:hypothetical protein